MAADSALPTLAPGAFGHGGRAMGRRGEVRQHRIAAVSDPFARAEAVSVIRSADAITAALSDEHPLVRRAAVRALGERGGPSAAPALLRAAAHDPSPEVREEAVAVLGAMVRGSTATSGRP